MAITRDDLREKRFGQPFRRFEFVLYDGRVFPVRDFIHFGWDPEGTDVFVADSQSTFTKFPMAAIESLRPMPFWLDWWRRLGG